MNHLTKIFLIIVLIASAPSFAYANDLLDVAFQTDLLGDAHYSRYNFTDIKKPYDGIDGYVEFKLAFQSSRIKYFSPYISVTPSMTTESEFWWQKNVTFTVGLQFYPFVTLEDTNVLKTIRPYLTAAWREYYDTPSGEDPEDRDFQIGVDYFYDNIFKEDFFKVISWTNAGYRKTNFTSESYKAFLWTGNIKLGPGFILHKSLVLPYVVVDWTYVPKYEDRFWENNLRAGAGLSWYPGKSSKHGILRRFRVYFEVLYNAAWLGDEPATDIEETDYRAGFGFSTGGFWGEE